MTPEGHTLLEIEAVADRVSVVEAVTVLVAVILDVVVRVADAADVGDGDGLGGTSTAMEPPLHATTMLPPAPMAGELLIADAQAAKDQRSAPPAVAAAYTFPSVPPTYTVLLSADSAGEDSGVSVLPAAPMGSDQDVLPLEDTAKRLATPVPPPPAM